MKKLGKKNVLGKKKCEMSESSKFCKVLLSLRLMQPLPFCPDPGGQTESANSNIATHTNEKPPAGAKPATSSKAAHVHSTSIDEARATMFSLLAQSTVRSKVAVT